MRQAMETGSFHYNISNPTYDEPCPCGGKHPPGRLIAWLAGSLRGSSDRDRPTEADARLIAAAPELLACLKAAAQDFSIMRYGKRMPEWDAAIAKASGGGTGAE